MKTFFVVLSLSAASCFAQQSSFAARCAVCHGGDAAGGDRAPSILSFIRYHTDAELSEVIQSGRVSKGMPSFALPPDELGTLVAHLRGLTGNQTMSTGGFTGQSRKPPAGRKDLSEPAVGSLSLANGQKLSGTILRSGEFAADVLDPDGSLHLLARLPGPEAVYQEKKIEPKANWDGYNGGVTGNRYSTLENINTSNVSRLKMAWLFPITTSPRIEATPVVVDGVMYVTGWNEVFALDATTGEQIWMFRQPHTAGLSGEAGRGANRGVAVSGNRLFVVTDHAHLLALDRRNGSKLWDVEMGDFKEGYSASGAPLVAGDFVISGVAGGEEGARGFVDAYNMATGERTWRFYSIPKRGEKGSETWVGNALEHGCGATWLTGSYDPELGLLYWQTGNPCPDFNGDERKGDNLYTASVVALSVRTGEMKWHYQFTPHDTHDWDATEPLLLIDQPWQDKPRKLLVQANRNGFFFVLDRTNGELLLAEPFVKVTWASGYGKDGRPILTANSESTAGGALVCPASSGGTNWFSASWSPLTKLYYVRATEGCATYKKQDDPLVDNRWFGGQAPNEPGLHGYIRALSLNTGKKVWEFPLSGTGRGGIVSTAGGLVFFGSSQGSLVALNAVSGELAWHFDAGQNWQASPMTYMVGGKQYIALSGPAGIFSFCLPD